MALSYEDHLKLSHAGVDSLEARITYRVESFVEDLFNRQTGYPLDMEVLQAVEDEYEAVKSGIEQQLVAMDPDSGFLMTLSWNPNSNPEAIKFLQRVGVTAIAGKSKTGRVSMPATWFEENEGLHESVKLISDYRKALRKVSMLKSFKNHIQEDPRTPFVTTSWKVLSDKGTARLFAEHYSITQVLPEIRRAFVAWHGWHAGSEGSKGDRWFYMDMSQAEIRFLALLSQDPQLIADLHKGDIYLAMAERFGLTPSSETRDNVKTFVYALLYGSTDERKMAGLVGFTDLTFFRVAYPTLISFMEQRAAQAQRDFIVDLGYCGRKRDLRIDPEVNGEGPRKPWEKPWDPGIIKRKAFNSLGQQNTSYFLKQLIYDLCATFPFLNESLWIPVFDSLSFTIPESPDHTIPEQIAEYLRQRLRDIEIDTAGFTAKIGLDRAWPASRKDIRTFQLHGGDLPFESWLHENRAKPALKSDPGFIIRSMDRPLTEVRSIGDIHPTFLAGATDYTVEFTDLVASREEKFNVGSQVFLQKDGKLSDKPDPDLPAVSSGPIGVVLRVERTAGMLCEENDTLKVQAKLHSVPPHLLYGS